MTVILGVGLGFALVLYLSSRIGSKGIFRNIALNTNLENSEGYISVEMKLKDLVGQEGVAHSDLRPSGKIRINGQLFDAVSEGDFIGASTPIRVIRFEMGQLYVTNLAWE